MPTLKEFWSRQETDDIGKIAVKLQKTIVFIFLCSLVYIIFSGLYGSMEAGLGWTFYISIIMWLMFGVGYYGAYKRSPSNLLAYFIIMIFWTMVQGFILFFTFVASIEHSECNKSDEDDHPHCPKQSSVALNWIAMVFLFIWWCAQFRSLTLSNRMRRMMLFGQASSSGSVQMTTFTTTTTANPVTPYASVYIQTTPGYSSHGYPQTTQFVQPVPYPQYAQNPQYVNPQYPPNGNQYPPQPYPNPGYPPTQPVYHNYPPPQANPQYPPQQQTATAQQYAPTTTVVQSYPPPPPTTYPVVPPPTEPTNAAPPSYEEALNS